MLKAVQFQAEGRFFLVLGLCFCSDLKLAENNGWEKSLTYGLFSEKLPMSLIEYSSIYNVNPKSELYFSAGSMLFASGVGSGFKYYVEDKYSNSIYLSSGLFLAIFLILASYSTAGLDGSINSDQLSPK